MEEELAISMDKNLFHHLLTDRAASPGGAGPILTLSFSGSPQNEDTKRTYFHGDGMK